MDLLDSYEFMLHRACQDVGPVAFRDAILDLANVLGTTENEVMSHYRFLLEEMSQEYRTSRRPEDPIIKRRRGGVQIVLDLGDVLKREVEAILRSNEGLGGMQNQEIAPQERLGMDVQMDVMPQNQQPQEPPRLEVVDNRLGQAFVPIDVDEPQIELSTVTHPPPVQVQAPSFSLRQAHVQTPEGASIALFYSNVIDQTPFPTNWAFLQTNDYKGLTWSQPRTTCRCTTLTPCKDSRLCPCAQYAGKTYSNSATFYTGNGPWKRVPVSGKTVRSNVYECGPQCGCDRTKCGLSFFSQEYEKVCRRDLVLVRTQYKDTGMWSVVSLSPIEKDQFVLEITGEVVVEKERPEFDQFTVSLGGKDSLFLDMSRAGSIARFLRHSCSPSLAVVRVYGGTGSLPRVALFSTREIGREEELTVNLEQFSALREQMVCDCGAKGCKGVIA